MTTTDTRGSTRSPLEAYLTEINETPLLSADEEKDLARRVLTGDMAARDHLVRANLRLVVNIARGFRGRGLDLPDLVAEGNMGLVRAVEGFDPNMNTRFSTYASYWVKQSIKRAVVNTAKTVRVPAYMVELLTKWRRATNKLADDLGRPPAEDEVARFMGLSKKKLAIIKKAIRVYNAAPSSDAGGDQDWDIGDVLADERSESPGAGLAAAEDLDRVMDLLGRMAPREAAVLRMRFGLDGEEPLTLKEVGERLGLTRERVRQIEVEALGKLREEMAV